MSGHGQTLHDRLTAARHTLAGQGLARIVCKATTEEIIGPKKKHLDYLLHCTNEPNVSIPQLANLLIERTQHSSWVVVFKALITVHHLMCYGNERFTQYLASNNCTFQLSNFLDKSSVQSAYDMSTFIRRYAKYLNEKALSYRTVAFDFCKVKRGKEDGMLRTMNTDKLLKTVPVLQSQLDSLLEFDCTANDLTNGVINSCFMLLFRDLIRLFACYNDGIINLLEKYFDMNKKNCRDALDIYKKFLIRMDRVAEFLKVAENVGIDKGDIPDLTKAPSSLLDALEQHLASVEGKKGATVTSPAARSSNLKSAVSALSSISSSFGNAAAANGTSLMQEVNGIRVDESARKALEEEAVAMNQLKFDGDSPHNNWEQPSWDNVERRMREMQTQPSLDSVTGSTKTNPFLTSPSEQSNDRIVDLFSTPAVSQQSSTKASEDLLCLSGNPFADSLYGGAPPPPAPQQQPIPSFMAFGTNGFQTSNAPAGFAGDASFAMAFGNSTPDSTSGLTSAVPAPASPEKGGVVDSLSLPVADPFAARSTSPSPTTELMRGAGTTPILTHAPDNVFGDTADDTAPTSDSAWGPTGTETSHGVEPSPFGAPFEPSFPAAGVSQKDQADWFGMNSGAEMPKLKSQALSSGLSAPPPSPFGGIDLESQGGGMVTTDNTSRVAPEQQQKVSAFDDLNFAIKAAMQGPKPVGSGPVGPPSLSSSLPGSGAMGPRPVFSQAIPPQAMAMGGAVSPGGGGPSSSLSRLDALAVGMQRASPSSGYGTPPSGMSSPAKSVAGFGATGTGFDAFGDVLQPTQAMGGAGSKAVNGTDAKVAGHSLIKGDLDSSLASLAQNLNINGPKHSIKKPGGHQWGSPKAPTKTGGANWSHGSQPPNANWSANQQQFPPAGGQQQQQQQWGAGGMMAGPFPQQPPSGITGLPQQQFPMRPMAPAGMGMGMNVGMSVTSNQHMPPQQQPMGMFMGQRPPGNISATQPTAAINDPFGAL